MTEGARARRAPAFALAAVLAIAFTVRFAAATALPNVHWPDEIFQSLEQAHRLVFGYGIVPWEFRAGARSWLLPGLLAPAMKLAAPLAPGASGYLAGVRAELCLLSLALPASAWALARRHGLRAAIVAALAVAGWFELVYFAPKALAEVVAAHAMIPALVALDVERAPSRRACLTIGALLGLSLALRPHLSPAVIVALAVGLRGRLRGHAAPIAIALVAVLLGAGALDAITWGAPFHSYVENFRANVLEHKSAAYGTAPFWAFAPLLWGAWSFAAMLLLPLAAFAARRARATSSAAVAVLLTHSALAHKEWRFVYPAIAIVIVLAACGLAELVEAIAARLPSRSPRSPRAWLIAAAALALFCAVSAERAWAFDLSRVALPGGLSGEPSRAFRHLAGSLRAFEALSADPGVCGVGLENRRWNLTGGYVYLHHDVPIFEIRSAQSFERRAPSFDAFVVHASAPPAIGPYARVACWDEACVYRRPGGCALAPDYDVNARLRAIGE